MKETRLHHTKERDRKERTLPATYLVSFVFHETAMASFKVVEGKKEEEENNPRPYILYHFFHDKNMTQQRRTWSNP